MFWQKQKNEFWRDVTGLGSSGLYFLLIIFFLVLQQNKIVIHLLVGFIIMYAVSGIIKLTYFKNRPHKESYHTNLEKIDASAFPSVHTARAIFIALTLSHVAPHAQYFLIALALLVGYSRIEVRKHDWKDVLGGIVLGWLTTLVTNSL